MAQKKKILHCFKRRHCEKTLSRTNSFVFTFSAVVVLPSDCILSFLFPTETDVLVPVLSRSTEVVVVNFVLVLKGAVSHALRMLNSLKSVQPNKKSNWRESSQIKWKSVSIVANRCSFCILSIYLNYLDIRLSCYSNFLENCGNPKRYLALQAKDVGSRR